MNKARVGINVAVSILISLSLALGAYGVSNGINESNAVTDVSSVYEKNINGSIDSIRSNPENNSDPTKIYLSVAGTPFGIRLYLDSAVVVGSEDILTKNGYVNPANEAGLQIGDIITHVGEKRVTDNTTLSDALSDATGEKVTLTVIRDSVEYKLDFELALCSTDGIYKAGLWVRDSCAGIGTLSFFSEQSGMYCGLGHGVCDIDMGELVPVVRGEALQADIIGCKKGTSSQVGELSGVFSEGNIGNVLENSEIGVYGALSETPTVSVKYPLASPSQVTKGKAQIISTVDDNGPQLYDIEITQINSGSQTKNIVISVTDTKLIEKTGGIVQGMSGSPIIQNGYIVGAVTHVFVDNPLGGYGIYAQTMFDRMTELSRTTISEAA